MADNESFFLQNFSGDFGTYKVEYESMQTEYKVSKPHHGLTETQYFSFSIPEKNIHAFLYLWMHPNLNVVSAGPLVFQGNKEIVLENELIDYRMYLPLEQIGGDLTHFKLENTYAVEMLDGGKTFRLTYEDKARGNSYDLVQTAVSAPMMWPSSRHFEQVMRVEGDLLLRGERHKVSGFSIRDRSWGEARLENPTPGPPMSWSTGTFGEDLAFNVTTFDHPATGPVWRDLFDVPEEKILKFGWMILDHEPVPIIRSRNRTVYDPHSLMPKELFIDITDARGKRHEIHGTVHASSPLNTWINVRVPICLTRWEYNGRIGWGEIQEAQWTDFIHLMKPRPAA